MPSGVYERTEEMRRNIGKGIKEVNRKKKITVEEKEIEIQKSIIYVLYYM